MISIRLLLSSSIFSCWLATNSQALLTQLPNPILTSSPHSHPSQRRHLPSHRHRHRSHDNDDDLPIANNQYNQEVQDELSVRAQSIEIAQARDALEHQNTRAFLKRKPVKLPYEQARKWVQYNLGVDTKDEFEEMVANGNIRTPYIPKYPQKYYTGTREWISWEHFLTGYHNKKHPPAIKPADGIFD